MIVFLFSLPSSPPPQPASRRQSWPGGEAETERAPARWAQPNVGGKATANQRGKQGRFQLLIAAAAATVLSRAFYTLHSFLWLFHSITIHTLKYESTLRSCLKWQTSCCSCVFAVCRSVFSKGFKEAREGALISLRRIHVRVCVHVHACWCVWNIHRTLFVWGILLNLYEPYTMCVVNKTTITCCCCCLSVCSAITTFHCDALLLWLK